MNGRFLLGSVAISILAAGPVSAAKSPVYLPTQKAVAIVTDGLPWSAEAPNGRSFELTLNRDGTGSIRGVLPFTLSTAWTVEGDALCISNTMISKCLRFTEIPGGLQGWVGDKPDLKVSR